MIISDTAVRKSISVVVLAVIIIILGVYSYSTLPRESDPDITIPNVFVSTNYRGVAPSDMETSVTIPIEKKLKGLEGVKKIQSVSAEGLSSINIEFITGTDIDKALQDVKDKVDEAKNELPTDLEDDPLVFEVNFSELPIVIFSMSGTCGLACLKDLAEDLKDEIEGISGVLEATVTGGLEREIRVEVIPEKLAYYGIPISALQQVVASENQNTSGGAIRIGDGRFQLRVPGEFTRPDEIYGLVVGVHEGEPVYLKDVATVVDSFKEEASRSRLDGREAVSIAVKKRAGENIITITDSIDDLIARFEPTWPADTEITKVMDKAKEIRLMVADLENNILSGLILVVVVILFVMGLRNAILVSLAIPFSMFLSFIVLSLLGITLNMVVLFALTLALGMLVDNAIVIVENIYRYMQQGVPRRAAAMKATSEVAYPVIGATATTLAAFSPMLFWPGIMGEFMRYLPITLIVTLSSSLFVAMVINPALASIFMKRASNDGTGDSTLTAEEVVEAGERPVEIRGPIITAYTKVIKGALKQRIVVVAASVAVLVLLIQIWLLVVGLEKPVEFFPDMEPKAIYVNVDMPEGADLEYSDRIIRQIERAIARVDGGRLKGPSDLANIDHIYAKAITGGGGKSFFAQNDPNNVGIQFIDLEDRQKASSDTVDEIRGRIEGIPGGMITVAAQQQGPPTGLPINIEISGENFRVLGRLAREVKRLLANLPHVEDIRDDYTEGSPSIMVTIDRQRAALFGLSTNAIGFALKTGYRGLDVSTYREGDDDYDITVQFSAPDREVLDVLRELMIPTPTGEIVPLTTIGKIDYRGGLGDIVRINNERVVTVKASVDETKIPGPVARAQAEELLKEFPLPPGYRMHFTGEFEFQKESEEFLSRAFAVALLLIFLILVSQFNSVSQPFIIMTSVILSLGGAFLGLTLFDQPFGIIMSGVGVISLAGIVVNNAIVLIDYINRLRERGMKLHDAIVAAGATRLRPVLMTAVTTILGLLPMVTGISYDFHSWSISWVSESSQWWQSMAIVVIFGLMVATFLTLIVVPTLYSLTASFHDRAGDSIKWVKRIYWKPYPWLSGEGQDKDGGTE
ncbi:MAG: efflux RND transporter permease subunit [Thermodesulfobacteriota bacterium]